MKKTLYISIILFSGATIFFAGFSLAIVSSESRVLSQIHSGAMELGVIKNAIENEKYDDAIQHINNSIRIRKNIMDMSSFLETKDIKKKRELLSQIENRMEPE